VLAFWSISAASADPLFSLDTQADFQAAIDVDIVKPQTDPDGDPSLADHYPDGTFMVSTVTAYTDSLDDWGFDDPDGGLVMQWGTDDVEAGEVYGQFLYEYPVDPNLIGKTLKMKVFPPVGIISVSLSIIDGAGFVRSWDWNVGAGPATAAFPLVNGVSNNVSIFVAPPGLGAATDATPVSNSYFDPLGLTNPANITTIGFDENGVWVAFTGVGPTGVPGPWNYFGRIQTVPEPGTLVLLAIGGMGLLAYAGRRRRGR
jgi:hypothetical protein